MLSVERLGLDFSVWILVLSVWGRVLSVEGLVLSVWGLGKARYRQDASFKKALHGGKGVRSDLIAASIYHNHR